MSQAFGKMIKDILVIIVLSISTLILSIMGSIWAMEIGLSPPLSEPNKTYAVRCGLTVGAFSILPVVIIFLLSSQSKRLRNGMLAALLIPLIGTLYNFFRWAISIG